jgi:GT2 family glycosyltransferase
MGDGMEKITPALSVAIATYGRGMVLVETIEQVLAQSPGELLILDQNRAYEPGVAQFLQEQSDQGALRWIRREEPSIPGALNDALLQAREDIVLFLDDDVVLAPGLLEAHWRAHASKPNSAAVVGQILQPGEVPTARGEEEPFRFNSTHGCLIKDLMAGNLSVKRAAAMAVGGFDENFLAVAYKFESEFGQRLARAGWELWFEPEASLRHLRASGGGTRSFGSHLRTASPGHSVGAYYFCLLENGGTWAWSTVLDRWHKTFCSRYLLRRPWWLPLVALAEIRGIRQAGELYRRGPKLLPPGGRQKP